MELEPVWISLGNPADLIGRDLKGKVAFILAVPEPGMRDNSAGYNGAMKRAQDAGAAAIVVALQLPGNVSSQMITSAGVTVPNFSIGMADMLAVRKLIEDGKSPKVTFHLNTEMVKGEKTATVWGELPGATDENMLIMAHTDAFFDGALDNASGVAVNVSGYRSLCVPQFRSVEEGRGYRQNDGSGTGRVSLVRGSFQRHSRTYPGMWVPIEKPRGDLDWGRQSRDLFGMFAGICQFRSLRPTSPVSL